MKYSYQQEDGDVVCCEYCGRFAKTHMIYRTGRGNNQKLPVCRLCATTSGIGGSLNPDNQYSRGQVTRHGVAEMIAEAAHFIVTELRGPECTCGEGDGEHAPLPHKTWCQLNEDPPKKKIVCCKCGAIAPIIDGHLRLWGWDAGDGKGNNAVCENCSNEEELGLGD